MAVRDQEIKHLNFLYEGFYHFSSRLSDFGPFSCSLIEFLTLYLLLKSHQRVILIIDSIITFTQWSLYLSLFKFLGLDVCQSVQEERCLLS